MFAAVAPILKMPRGTGCFDYSIPDALATAVTRGSVVSVPWRGKKIPGLVLFVREKSEIPASRTKPLTDIVPVAALTEELIATIEWMAEDTFASIETFVHAFLPAFLKKMPVLASAAPQQHAADGGRRLIRYRSTAEKWQRTLEAARAGIAKGGSVIVIVPHIGDVAAASTLLQDAFGADNLIALLGDTASATYRKAWLACAERSGRVVVGTRVAAMAPVSALSSIIVHEAESQDLGQYDQNPRYDARRTAIRRSELAGAELLLMSRFPRLEEYQLAIAAGCSYDGGDRGGTKPSLVDVSSTTPTDFDKILSPAAMEAAEKALQSQKKVVLFHNRQGVASALLCRACRHVFRCPTCETAFVVQATKLECRRCGRSQEIAATCPRCGSPELRTVGRGTTSLERELQSRFPRRRIVRVDADQPAADIEPVVASADILVGTAQLVHALAELRSGNGDIGAIIATSVDDLVGHPGFRTQERAARTLAILGDVAAESGAAFIAQCLEPDRGRVRHLHLHYEAYAHAELAERGRTGYPPVGAIIALTVVGENEEAVRAEAGRIRGGLEPFLAGAEIRGPLRPGTPFRHGRWRSFLILKMPALAAETAEALMKLPDHVLIERDPESLP
ncbi:hypothetical protein HY633_05470 [Candidatus Uhrbacteria bacterium]|nr:hypothetical protein [Candidatus Uhrbacteria bacterium]